MSFLDSFTAAYKTELGTWLWVLLALFVILLLLYGIIYLQQAARKKQERRQKLYAEISAKEKSK